MSLPASSPMNQALVGLLQTLFAATTLLFHRYIDISTKYLTRRARGPRQCRVFQLSANSPLPPQNQVLNVSENKRQLIQFIIETLVQSQWEHQGKIIVTGQEDDPIQIAPDRVIIRSQDLKTTQEEEDVVLVVQAFYAAKKEEKQVVIVADDTGVYLLLLCHYYAQSLDILMKFQSTELERALIDVKATMKKLR